MFPIEPFVLLSNQVIETCLFYYHAIGLLNRFLWMQRRNPLCSDDVLLFKTSVSFVDHLQEFLSAVLTSTTLVIPPSDWRANPASLASLIKVTLLSYMSSVFVLVKILLCSFLDMKIVGERILVSLSS